MLYLIIGMAVFVSFLLFVKWLSSSNPENTARLFKYLFVILACVLSIILFRFGMPLIASAFAAIAAFIPYFRKIVGILYALNIFRNFFRSKGNAKGKINSSSQKKPMNKRRACKILGVSENASEDEIKKAYNDLMRKNHPDKGGSEYIAQQLNEAKDTLLS